MLKPVSLPSAKTALHVQAKYTAKAEDKISEARGKPAQGALNEEASVSRYNAMRAAAAAAINRCAPVTAIVPLPDPSTGQTLRCLAQ